jgi:hypothetical protein
MNNNELEPEPEIEEELELEPESELEELEIESELELEELELGNTEDLFYVALADRHQFEIDLYDFLINPMALIPQGDSFWDPVIVNLSELQIEKIEFIEKDSDCFICTSTFNYFKQVPCCSKLICDDCTDTWFCKSVKCPYCKQDLREFI